MSIQNYQEAFKDFMLYGDKQALLDYLSPKSADDREGRLSVYLNNHHGILVRTLMDIYSTVSQVVGEDKFRELAQTYAHDTPSVSYDLNLYGQDLHQYVFDDFVIRAKAR